MEEFFSTLLGWCQFGGKQPRHATAVPKPSNQPPISASQLASITGAATALLAGAGVFVTTESGLLLLQKKGAPPPRVDPADGAAPAVVAEIFATAAAALASLNLQKQPLAAPIARLAGRYWPGPLILQIVGHAGGGDLIVRVPADEVVTGILETVYKSDPGSRWVATEWKTPRGTPVATLRQAPASLRAGSMLLEGSRKPGDIPAAIVKFSKTGMEVVREGLLNTTDLRTTAGRRILLVCTGNTCRSPMAAAVLRSRIARALAGVAPGEPVDEAATLESFGYRIESAGIAPFPGSPASANAVAAAAEMQLSLAGHRAQVASEELLQQFDIALGLTSVHARRLGEFAPNHIAIEPLDATRDIDDPFGGALETYRKTLKRIVDAIDRRLPLLL